MTPPSPDGPARTSAPVPWSAAGESLRRTLTTREAAEYTGIATSTLEKKRVYGGGPSFTRLGRSIRYRIQDLGAYLEARVYTSTSEYTLH